MSTLTLASFQLPNNHFTGSTCKLRVYYNRTFLDSAGTEIIGGGIGSKDFFVQVSCTISSGVITVPAFNLITTDDGLYDQNVLTTAVLYTSTNVQKDFVWQNFVVSNTIGPSTTLAVLTGFNQAVQLTITSGSYLNEPNTITLIQQMLANAALNQDFSILTFTSFSAALAAMPTTGATLVINAATSVTSSLVSPSYVTLRFTGRGQLIFNTGAAIDIRGPIEAPPKQIFVNATAGLGTVTLDSNNAQKDYWVEWWGALGDGITDDTATLQAAFDAQPHGTTMHFSPHKNYAHTGIVMVDHKFSVTVAGIDGLSPITTNGTMPILTYMGINGGTAIRTINAYTCTFKGFTSFAGTGGPTGAAINFHLDQDSGGPTPISTRDVFQSVYLQALNTRSDYIGLNVNNSNESNNEQHQITQCGFFGSSQNFGSRLGTGLFLGHANAKQIHIEYTSFSGLAKAISCSGGSFRGLNNVMSSVDIMYFGSFGDAVYVVGEDSEDCTQILQVGPAGSGTPWYFMGCRWQTLRGGLTGSPGTSTEPIIQWPGALTLENCLIGDINNTTGFEPRAIQGFAPDDASANGSLIWKNVSISMSIANLNDCFETFLQVERGPHNAASGAGGILVGGSGVLQNSLQGKMSTPMMRDVIGVTRNADARGNFMVPQAENSIAIGEAGQIEIGGLATPVRPTDTYTGANDLGLPLILSLIARDSLGNRSMPGILNQGVRGNSVLSGVNFITMHWPKVPGATDYLLLQFSGGTWRVIATVLAGGTDFETYNITTNPVGVFTYTIPTYNETATNKFRGRIQRVNENTLSPDDNAPSVAKGDRWLTANTVNTVINNFANGVDGQVIYVLVNDTHTTFQHGSGINTRTGAPVSGIQGLMYTFMRRTSEWYQL